MCVHTDLSQFDSGGSLLGCEALSPELTMESWQDQEGIDLEKNEQVISIQQHHRQALNRVPDSG